ncbi:MAG: HAD-IA family hydrolase [Gammaproteobacteria bacterium]
MKTLIFDLDGTLVDSEPLCNQAFLNLLPELDDSLEVLTNRYRGIELKLIFIDLEKRIGRALPDDFVESYRAQAAVLFEHELQVMEGAVETLSRLSHPKCIASSGPLAKINHSLSLTGLDQFFGYNIFSAYEINSWKPDPGLFLHAAKAMNVFPCDCIVIEDSEVGLLAAEAAGIQSIHYNPHNIDLCDELTTARNRTDSHSIASLSELPELLATLD